MKRRVEEIKVGGLFYHLAPYFIVLFVLMSLIKKERCTVCYDEDNDAIRQLQYVLIVCAVSGVGKGT